MSDLIATGDIDDISSEFLITGRPANSGRSALKSMLHLDSRHTPFGDSGFLVEAI